MHTQLALPIVLIDGISIKEGNPLEKVRDRKVYVHG